MASEGQHIVFLQPFGISSPCGGSRILRALLQDAPLRWTSVCSLLQAPAPAAFGNEIHLPPRPYFGRIERTRFNWLPNATERLFARKFRRRLEAVCTKLGATAIHAIPHRSDFIHGYRVARKLGLEYFFNVHDDLAGAIAGHPNQATGLLQLGEIWRDSDVRFVISEQMGLEYSARYGDRPFTIVTDGLDHVCAPQIRPPHRLNLYFMGMFHSRYEANLRVLTEAIRTIRLESPALSPTVTLRCGLLPNEFTQNVPGLSVLPFGSEADVKLDMKQADLLYLPLPFGREHRDFVRHSLSTKLITYLGSGIPILYHGPAEAAACTLLREHRAAIIVDSLETPSVSAALREFLAQPGGTDPAVTGARTLARQRFMLSHQREHFWGEINRTRKANTAAARQNQGLARSDCPQRGCKLNS